MVSSLANEVQDNSDIRIIFQIQDTGVGIGEDEIEQIFEAFTQTEAGQNSQEGTGLGLPISRRFIQLMGGDISVKSKIGVGTTFIFDIPVTIINEVDLQTKPLYRHVIALKSGQPRYRILIVDDRPTNRLLMIKLLQPLGFELKEASNGVEAIKIWDNWSPHLIWMDMRMPVMDGYEATQHIKGTTKGNATAVIALTASVLEEEKAIVLSTGCDDFVRKPFQEAVIFETMAKHLGVEYIYEENDQLDIPTQSKPLNAEDFKIMPEKWRQELYQAAIDLDDDLVFQLIAEIPPDNSLLAEQLTDLVDNFQLKKIRILMEEI